MTIDEIRARTKEIKAELDVVRPTPRRSRLLFQAGAELSHIEDAIISTDAGRGEAALALLEGMVLEIRDLPEPDDDPEVAMYVDDDGNWQDKEGESGNYRLSAGARGERKEGAQ